MTARKNTDSAPQSKDPHGAVARPHWRTASPALLALFERFHEAAKKGGGSNPVRLAANSSAPVTSATLTFVQRVMAQGFDLERSDIPTPACDSVAAFTGSERRRVICQRGIATAVRLEEQALALYDARVAAGYREQPRVDSHALSVEVAAQREAAIAARACEIAAEELAAQRAEVEARALARATAEIMKGTHV